MLKSSHFLLIWTLCLILSFQGFEAMNSIKRSTIQWFSTAFVMVVMKIWSNFFWLYRIDLIKESKSNYFVPVLWFILLISAVQVLYQMQLVEKVYLDAVSIGLFVMIEYHVLNRVTHETFSHVNFYGLYKTYNEVPLRLYLSSSFIVSFVITAIFSRYYVPKVYILIFMVTGLILIMSFLAI